MAETENKTLTCTLCDGKIQDLPSGDPGGKPICGDCVERVGKIYTQAVRSDYCALCGARIGILSWSSGEDMFCFPCWGRFERMHGHSPGADWAKEEKNRIEQAKKMETA